MVPVCSPELIDCIPEVSPEMVAQFPLLHLSSRDEAWKHWFAAVGIVNDIRPLKGCRFELFTMLTSAAMAGLGVALVPEIFVCAELDSRRLLVPTAHFIPYHDRHFLSYNHNPINHKPLPAFDSF